VTSKPVYYWDACMFYEWLGNEPVASSKRDALQALIEESSKKNNLIYTSVISHLEVVPRKLNDSHAMADQRYTALFDGVHFHEAEISRNILMRAREIRDYYYHPADPALQVVAKLMDDGDAVHLATATIFGCTEFHTRDNSDKGVKIPLLRLYDYNRSSTQKVCEKYPLNIISPENTQSSFGFSPNAQASPAP
jgi:hypothetical protein